MTANSPSSAATVRVAVAVVERDGAYLIGRRPAGVPLAGLWEFPGGKIHPGETPEAAAVRECREETGLIVEAVALHSQVSERYAHALVEIFFVACRPTDHAEPRTPFQWVGAADLPSYEFPTANKALIRHLAG